MPIQSRGISLTELLSVQRRPTFLQALSSYQIAGVPGVPVLVEGESRTKLRPSYEDEIDQWRQTRAASVAADEINVEDKFGAFLGQFEVLEGDNDQEPITLRCFTTIKRELDRART